ncbi:hypothetical protein ZWY2020_015122 [Hordeum vulgare]|nr:hypothetical protein ZWY2020_015122 [Hordeum vulgare]
MQTYSCEAYRKLGRRTPVRARVTGPAADGADAAVDGGAAGAGDAAAVDAASNTGPAHAGDAVGGAAGAAGDAGVAAGDVGCKLLVEYDSMKKEKASSGYKGVQVRLSGRWSAELQQERLRYYLGTFDTINLAARAYDVVGCRLGVPQEELKFPDITSLQDAIFVGPPMKNRVKTRLVKKEESARVIETDAEALARVAREPPE